MYVDDVLAGKYAQQSAVSAMKKLRGALESAGFPLRKWTSNEKKLSGIGRPQILQDGYRHSSFGSKFVCKKHSVA